MVIKKYWRKYRHKRSEFSDRMGYFLFGLIPIYMECHPWRNSW
jgi:hypothetical protein